MKFKNIFLKTFPLILIILVQYILAIFCVFLFPGLGEAFLLLAPLSRPFLGHLSLLIAYSVGIFVGGWLGLVLFRKKVKKDLIKRLLWMLISITIPLSITLIAGEKLRYFLYFIAILTGIVGFYLVEWLNKPSAAN
jgi:type II secretory pathway component PulF